MTKLPATYISCQSARVQLLKYFWGCHSRMTPETRLSKRPARNFQEQQSSKRAGKMANSLLDLNVHSKRTNDSRQINYPAAGRSGNSRRGLSSGVGVELIRQLGGFVVLRGLALGILRSLFRHRTRGRRAVRFGTVFAAGHRKP